MCAWKILRHQRRLWLLLSGAILLGFGAVLLLARLFHTSKEADSHHATVRVAIPLHEATRRDVHLYFPTRSGRYLQAEARRIEAGDVLGAAEALVAALTQGPESPELVSPIPTGTQLRRCFLTEDGTAYVDFSSELSRLHPGGVTAERLTLYAIVNTLVLNLHEVERVQLLLEGKPEATLAGHLDIRRPKTADLLLIR